MPSSRLPLVISIAALLVAVLGSTPLGQAIASQVPRNSVGTPQLKRNAVKPAKLAPNAVRTAHVLNGSLLAVDFKQGQLPRGPKGDQGDRGDKGDTGAIGVAEVEIVTAQSASSSSQGKSVTATCPSGKRAVGGGGSVIHAEPGSFPLRQLTLQRSHPQGTNAWTVFASETNDTATFWRLIAYAVCSRVS